jgi:hypothetical protein
VGHVGAKPRWATLGWVTTGHTLYPSIYHNKLEIKNSIFLRFNGIFDDFVNLFIGEKGGSTGPNNPRAL